MISITLRLMNYMCVCTHARACLTSNAWKKSIIKIYRILSSHLYSYYLFQNYKIYFIPYLLQLTNKANEIGNITWGVGSINRVLIVLQYHLTKAWVKKLGILLTSWLNRNDRLLISTRSTFFSGAHPNTTKSALFSNISLVSCKTVFRHKNRPGDVFWPSPHHHWSAITKNKIWTVPLPPSCKIMF